METLSILEEVINRKAKKEAVEVLCKISRKLHDTKYVTIYPNGFKTFNKLSKKNKQTSKWFDSLIARINIEIRKLNNK